MNLGRVARNQLRTVSEQFKEASPEIGIWHVLDRQFDGVPFFEFITDDLNDKFVIRLKISRNSNEKRVDEEGREVAVKVRTHFFGNRESQMQVRHIQ